MRRSTNSSVPRSPSSRSARTTATATLGAEILSVLRSLGALIARTDREGYVAVWKDEDAASVWRERAGEGDVAPAR